MGYEPMEDREPFRFLAAVVSGQPHPRREDHRQRSLADPPSYPCRFEDGGQQLTDKQHLSGSAVPPTADPMGLSGCDQGHGRQASLTSTLFHAIFGKNTVMSA